MKIRIVSFTDRGGHTARNTASALGTYGHECTTYALPKYAKEGDTPLIASVSEWAGEAFSECDALIFICACGIAVRAIAPYVRDKTEDPAVICSDEEGRYVIPVLSGHIGGANELAEAIADILGGTAVITTATDINNLFAVDVFAQKNNLRITDMHIAKEVSAALLRGEPVGFYSDVTVRGDMPPCLTCGEAKTGIAVSAKGVLPYERTLTLVPMRYAVGMGCRRGKTRAELYSFLTAVLTENGISEREIRCIASIDIKKDEKGLAGLCDALRVPFVTYAADELNEAAGDFTPSDFVKEITGVDSVCERAACLCTGGALKIRKTARDGMTIALSEYEEEISFV